jgi:hypothetical protein
MSVERARMSAPLDGAEQDAPVTRKSAARGGSGAKIRRKAMKTF